MEKDPADIILLQCDIHLLSSFLVVFIHQGISSPIVIDLPFGPKAYIYMHSSSTLHYSTKKFKASSQP